MADKILNNGLILPDFLDNMVRMEDLQNQRTQRQRATQDYQRSQSIQAASDAARQQYAAGDFAGARDTAAAGNAWDVWKTIDDAQKAQVAAQAADIGGAAYNLSRLEKGQARIDYFNAFVPTLRSHGMSEEEIQQFANSAFLDNDDTLRGYADRAVGISNLWKADQERLKAAYDRETDLMKPVTAADGAVLTRAEDGSFTPVYTPGTRPMQEIIKNEDGSFSYVNIPGTAGNSYSPGNGDTWSRMIAQESGGRQFAANGQPLTSSAGAIGVAQVMPGTAPEAARMAGLPWDANRYRTDPDYNRALGQAYYRQQLADFGGDEEKAAAAYNAGPGRVRQALRHGDQWRQHLPAETRQYIARVAPRAPQGPGPRVNPSSNVQVTNLGGGRSGPEWQDETREINGQQIVGQRNQRTGEFKPMGGQGKNAPKPQDLKSQATAIDQTLRTVDSLLKHDGLNAAVGVPSANPFDGNLAGYIVPGSRASDFRTRAGTLKSQIFLAQIGQMKGLGALTDAEGQRLEQSIASLDFAQSEEQYRANLNEIRSYFQTARQRIQGLQRGAGGQQPQQTRVVNGRTYAKVPGGWRAQ